MADSLGRYQHERDTDRSAGGRYIGLDMGLDRDPTRGAWVDGLWIDRSMRYCTCLRPDCSWPHCPPDPQWDWPVVAPPDDLAAARGILLALLLTAAFVVALAVGYGLASWIWP